MPPTLRAVAPGLAIGGIGLGSSATAPGPRRAEPPRAGSDVETREIDTRALRAGHAGSAASPRTGDLAGGPLGRDHGGGAIARRPSIIVRRGVAMTWAEVASLDDLPAGGSLEFSSGGRAYALFRSPDGSVVTCLDGLCPHNRGRLARGPFDGSRVTCPRPGCLRWSFDVRTGASSAGEPTRRRVHPARVEGRSIRVALPGD